MGARTAGLDRVATLDREIRASLERIWENVLDWEHLPWLHASSFSRIEREASGDWGWRARVCTASRPDEELTIELRIERDALRYVTRTVEGRGAGTEIWTTLAPRGAERTDIHVEFWLPGVPEREREALGSGYEALYQQLWDEDEEMMRERAARLAERASRGGTERADVELGSLAALRERLPLRVEAGGSTWRIVELDGALLAHSTRCPHRLGPLPGEPCDDLPAHELRCPWHGYRFDLRTGRSSDGRALRLATPPRIEVRPKDETVVLRWDASG